MNAFVPDGCVPLPDAIEQARQAWFRDDADPARAKANATMRIRQMLFSGDIMAVGFDDDATFRLEPHFWATDDAQDVLTSGKILQSAIGVSVSPYYGIVSEPSYRLFIPLDELNGIIGNEPRQSRALRPSDRANIIPLIEDPALTRGECKRLVAERFPELRVTVAEWNKLFQEFPRQTGRRQKP